MASLHDYSLRQKLILFAVLPILTLAIFGIIRAMGLHQEFQTASRNALAIQISGETAELVYALQHERSLSMNYLSDKPTITEMDLKAQQAKTDLSYRHLLQSHVLERFSQGLAGDEAMTFNEVMGNIKTSANRLPLVRQAVQQHQWDEPGFFNRFNDELLLLVNQLQHQTNDAAQSRAYSDLLLVLRIQELAARERGLMTRVLSANTLELSSFNLLETLIKEQRHGEDLALDTFEEHHRVLLQKLQSSLPSQQVENIRAQVAQQRNISQLAWEMSDSLGYGGLIHSYKNFLLRGDEVYAGQFNQKWDDMSLLLAKLKALPNLSPEQRGAIDEIKHTLLQYHKGIPKIRQLRAAGMPVQAIDAQLRVDDSRLRNALDTLRYPAPPVNARLWWELANERTAMLQDMARSIAAHIQSLSQYQMTISLTYIGIYAASALLTLILSLLLGRKITASFMGKIESIASDMQKMADDPKLELTIKTKGSDEIAAMAEAMNKMLKERKKYRQALVRAAAVFEYSAEGIMVTDADNHIELINPAFSQITGYGIEEVKGRNPSILSSHRNPPHLYDAMWESLRSTGKWEGEIWNRRKDGEVYPEYLAITLVRDDEGQIVHHIGLFMDISRRKQYEQDIWYKANFDTLTDLPNRKLLSERLGHELKMAEHDGRKLAVMVLDLDRFKYINDTQGHDCGDLLLKAVAKRLQTVMGSTDFIARLGGDEFVIVLPRLAQEHAVEQYAKRLLQSMADPFKVEQGTMSVSASLGIGLYPQDGLDVETLLSNAETAMYGAKDEGRNHFKYFTQEMNLALIERLGMEHDLRRAVANDEFCLFYQPVVDMESGEVTSLEALLRWQDPEQGLVSPVRFIPVAEDMGLMGELGQWVMDKALADLARLHAMGFGLSMAINVSACQCHCKRQSLDEQLRSALSRHGIAPRHLHVEITESLLLDNSHHCLDTLNNIRDLGCAIYLDDFGTGYSSLSYLKKFPISAIKIDKSFVEQLPGCESDASLVRAIVNMSKSLGMKLVAEGIESKDQQAFLQALGSQFGQGYLYSRPLPFEELLPWLERRQHNQPDGFAYQNS